ncbi:MAG: hypothetical protein PHD48_11330 [Alphaproteobacteria bacterium]|nr:hypothetical protein [Alphaproteobacteria bacterium]
MRIALMLAFQSVISQGENAKSKEAAQRIVALARLMNEFCDLHIAQMYSEERGV